MKLPKPLLALCALLFFAALYFLAFPPERWRDVSVGGVPVRALVADNPLETSRGLSGRPRLEPNEGMLFIFPASSKLSFWMKDMLFPIDIIWIGSNKRVVDVSPNLAPETYPTNFSPKSAARYVLEVNAGFSETHNIQEGDLVEW